MIVVLQCFMNSSFISKTLSYIPQSYGLILKWHMSVFHIEWPPYCWLSSSPDYRLCLDEALCSISVGGKTLSSDINVVNCIWAGPFKCEYFHDICVMLDSLPLQNNSLTHYSSPKWFSNNNQDQTCHIFALVNMYFLWIFK